MKILRRLRQRVVQRLKPEPFTQSLPQLHQWPDSPLGKSVLSSQQQQLEPVLEKLFGYHLLELSAFGGLDLDSASPIGHCFSLLPTDQCGEVKAISELDQLPLADASIDVVVMHHVLDYAENPHQLLREANRVLIARGHLIVCGFNPFSLQGLVKSIAQWRYRKGFWKRSSLRKGRLCDWLRLLDCEPVAEYKGFFGYPFNTRSLLDSSSFIERWCQRLSLPFAGYYILVARKDIVAVTPSKPVWAGFKPVPGLAIGRPATRVAKVVDLPKRAESKQKNP